jgi:galactose mutarotase-like enzyme
MITIIKIPSQNKDILLPEEVTLCNNLFEDIVNKMGPYFCCIVGRVANRIKDGKFSREEGYPGNVDATVTYTLCGNDILSIDVQAKSNKSTPINWSIILTARSHLFV